MRSRNAFRENLCQRKRPKHLLPKIPLETQLGLLAMRFRSTRDESERDKVAGEYEHVVDELIARGKWKEMPSFEDMLPDERMPEAFFTFWSIPVPPNMDGLKRKR
jgi:hypothetical protein